MINSVSLTVHKDMYNDHSMTRHYDITHLTVMTIIKDKKYVVVWSS